MLPGVQVGAHGISDGGEDHGNVLVLGGVEAGHGGVGGDAHHQIYILGGEGVTDLGGHGVVKVGVAVIHLEVHAFLQPGLFQALEEALPAVVQRAVLAVLADADEVLGGGAVAGIIGSGLLAAAGGQGQGQGQSQSGGYEVTEVFHSDSPILKSK